VPFSPISIYAQCCGRYRQRRCHNMPLFTNLHRRQIMLLGGIVTRVWTICPRFLHSSVQPRVEPAKTSRSFVSPTRYRVAQTRHTCSLLIRVTVRAFERPLRGGKRDGKGKKRKKRENPSRDKFLVTALKNHHDHSVQYLPYKHLIGEYAKRPPVDRLVVSFALNYLRRQVLGCSTQRPRTVYTFNRPAITQGQ